MSKRIKVIIDNPRKTMNRIIDDKTRLFASETWAKYFKKYTPRDSGFLGETYTTEPGKVTYTSPYAHFQWEGRVMVDENGSTWAKKDHKKYYTNRKLKYSYPNASSHWEEVAEKNHKSAVADEITQYLKRR